jgi:hypothetical protein
MASPSITKRPKETGSKRRYIIWAIAAICLIAVAWFAYNYRGIKGQAELAAAYGAHITCSCRYIAGRELDNCKRDFEPGMDMLTVTDDPETKRITASIPFLAKAIAERRGAYGCITLNKEEMATID